MRTNIVTLLTDFGWEDEYVGLMHGVILSINRSARLVDLCHQIPRGDVRRAAWMLAWAVGYFPRGTVHVAVVDPGVGSDRRILCLAHRGHLFLAPDNGLLTLLLERVSRPRLYELRNRAYALEEVSHTFHGRDLFAPAAGHLSKGLPPSRLGPRVGSFVRMKGFHPVQVQPGVFRGQVIHLDRFGNATTNLPQRLLQRLGKKGLVELRVGGRRIRGIRSSYSAVPKGRSLLVLGSRGYLELSVNQGSAAEILRLREGMPVTVASVSK